MFGAKNLYGQNRSARIINDSFNHIPKSTNWPTASIKNINGAERLAIPAVPTLLITRADESFIAMGMATERLKSLLSSNRSANHGLV